MPSRPLAIGHAAAHAIERTRTARGYSQRQLAARVTALGRLMTFTALSRIERTVRRCDIDDLVAIAAALGIPPRRPSSQAPSRTQGRPGWAEYSRRSPVSETGDSPDDCGSRNARRAGPCQKSAHIPRGRLA
ncbi:helix-turn-helix domain-containing protein [Streptomyces sp. NPDC056529]|uniref:helix-turn-helix domain-containing protein n=1 Tax=Streptomyces sp. NPDC056529 TaxID=3345855 RepID=UPI0036836FCF